MLLISVNRSGRPGVSGLWASRSVGIACLLGRLHAHASISLHAAFVCTALRPGCARPPLVQGPSLDWLFHAGRQKEFHNSAQCAAWTCSRRQCDPEWQLIVCTAVIRGLFARRQLRAMLDVGNTTKLSLVPHLQRLRGAG